MLVNRVTALKFGMTIACFYKEQHRIGKITAAGLLSPTKSFVCNFLTKLATFLFLTEAKITIPHASHLQGSSNLLNGVGDM